MIYNSILPARFLTRPNRFIATIELEGKEEICHVKNTGRCRELLLPGADIFVQRCDNPARKTKYDLISVYKGDRLINMDSQAPNPVCREWLEQCGRFGDITLIKPECRYRDSRFDFYLESDGIGRFIEVKGVTLERDGAVFFPDAPTLRGVKHLKELATCIGEGYRAAVVFIVQMSGVSFLSPNDETHPEFGNALRAAANAGVEIIALDCKVTPNEIKTFNYINIIL